MIAHREQFLQEIDHLTYRFYPPTVAGRSRSDYTSARARLSDIRQLFGNRVAEVIIDCLETEVNPNPSWLAHKGVYLTHLKSALSTRQRVSCCDKLCNARSIEANP